MDIPSLFMIPSAVSSGKVHSVFPNSTDADFNFNRDSSATRVNSQGLIETVGYFGSELVSNGNFTNGSSNWSLTSEGTITTNGANINNLIGGAISFLQQNNVTVIGRKYKLQYYIRENNSGSLKFNTAENANLPIPSTVGVHTLFFTASLTEIIFARLSGSTDITIDDISIVEVTGDRARLNYEIEGGLVNTKPSLLLEPQSTNLITYSEDYSQSSWNKLNAQVIRTVETSPDGNNTNVFNLTGTNGNLYVGATTGVEYTISVYIKSNNKNKDKFKLRLGNNISSEYEATNEWIRYDFTSTPTTGVLGITTSSSPDNEFDLLVWGFQLEQQSYATSYIPTNGSTQTRAAETCNGAGTSSIFESTKGILFCDISSLADDLTNRIISISDGTSNNRVLILYQVVSNKIRGQFSVSGQSSKTIDHIADTTQFRKIAFSWNSTSVKLYIDGQEIGETTTGFTFSANALSELAFDNVSGGEFYGKIRDIRVYNTKEMTDSEVDILLTKITS